MKQRTIVRLVSYCLAALLTMGGFLCQTMGREAAYRRYVEAGWARAFSSLGSELGQIDTALHKCRHASSPTLVGSACAEIAARSDAALERLGELPFSGAPLEQTAGFLGRLGSYAQALGRSAYRGAMTEADRETLAALHKTAGQLADELTRLQGDLDEGLLRMDQLSAMEQAAVAQPLLGQSLRDFEDQFPELPTLIYDGPYSNSVKQGAPRLLEGLPTVSEGEALRAAAAFSGLQEGALQVVGRSAGALPCYVVQGSADGAELTLRITRQGGTVLDMVSAQDCMESRLTEAEGVAAAAAFLESHGLKDMKDSYWTRSEHSLLVNFAYTQDGVVCYPDLVKVSVSLETGRVLSFDATGYVMNHHRRSLPAPVDASVGRAAVSGALTILSEGLAVIPTDGKQERFCREYKCSDADGIHYLVYADAATGEEAQLLLLLEDENGTLAL